MIIILFLLNTKRIVYIQIPIVWRIFYFLLCEAVATFDEGVWTCKIWNYDFSKHIFIAKENRTRIILYLFLDASLVLGHGVDVSVLLFWFMVSARVSVHNVGFASLRQISITGWIVVRFALMSLRMSIYTWHFSIAFSSRCQTHRQTSSVLIVIDKTRDLSRLLSKGYSAVIPTITKRGRAAS